jgi:hypothetical protein
VNSYRVESCTTDTGRVRPGDGFRHEFDATDDVDAVRVAVVYATSQHGPDARSRVFRRMFLGWLPVADLHGAEQTMLTTGSNPTAGYACATWTACRTTNLMWHPTPTDMFDPDSPDMCVCGEPMTTPVPAGVLRKEQ